MNKNESLELKFEQKLLASYLILYFIFKPQMQFGPKFTSGQFGFINYGRGSDFFTDLIKELYTTRCI